jgi:hypothetical protein
VFPVRAKLPSSIDVTTLFLSLFFVLSYPCLVSLLYVPLCLCLPPLSRFPFVVPFVLDASRCHSHVP